MREALSVAEVTNDALELGDVDLVAFRNPVVEHRSHALLVISERTDFGVEGRLLGAACIVGPACNCISDQGFDEGELRIHDCVFVGV